MYLHLKLECTSWNIFKSLYLYQNWIVCLQTNSKLICICIKLEFFFLNIYESRDVFVSKWNCIYWERTNLSWFVFALKLNSISWKSIAADLYCRVVQVELPTLYYTLSSLALLTPIHTTHHHHPQHHHTITMPYHTNWKETTAIAISRIELLSARKGSVYCGQIPNFTPQNT